MREHATKLDANTIAAHNLDILTRNMREELASERRARFGIADGKLEVFDRTSASFRTI